MTTDKLSPANAWPFCGAIASDRCQSCGFGQGAHAWNCPRSVLTNHTAPTFASFSDDLRKDNRVPAGTTQAPTPIPFIKSLQLTLQDAIDGRITLERFQLAAISECLGRLGTGLAAANTQLEIANKVAAEFQDRFLAANAQIKALRADYQELLYAVGSKWPNETRHQTALRYIRERENQGHSSGNTVQVDAARGKP